MKIYVLSIIESDKLHHSEVKGVYKNFATAKSQFEKEIEGSRDSYDIYAKDEVLQAALDNSVIVRVEPVEVQED